MPPKKPKKSNLLGLRFEPKLAGDFAEATAQSNLTPQDALRLAAHAMVAVYKTSGRIPRDMKIVQDFVALTEDQKKLMHAVAELGAAYELSLPNTPGSSLKPGPKEKPPDNSQRHRGDGPRSKVS